MRQGQKRRVLDPRSFVVYYGRGPLPGMEAFDLAILEPSGWSESDRSALQAVGVTTLAYLSVLEATPAVASAAGLGRADLLSVAGAPWYRSEYGTTVVHPRAARWRTYLQSTATALVRQGWDGLFFDTLGDLEDPLVQGELGSLLPGAAALVHQIRQGVPDAYLVQNNGVWVLLPLVVSDLDGVCWESSVALAQAGPFADAALASLTLAKNRYGVTPLLLSAPQTEQQCEGLRLLHDLSHRFGFCSYVAPPGGYAQGIRLPSGHIRVGH